MYKLKMFLVLCLIIFCALKADTAGDENLVLYLPFDEGAGTAAEDFSGGENHGAINGDVKWVNGRHNKALEFSGDISQYVEVADSESLQYGEEPFTYMAWIKAYELEFPQFQTIISKRVPVAGDGNPTASLFIQSEKTHLFVEFRDSIQGMFAFEAEDAVLTANVWHHVAWVKDDSELRFYIDGDLKQKVDHDRVGELNTTQPLYVGVHHYGDTWNAPFIGIIDEVAVFNSSLDENDMTQFMENVLPVQPLEKLTTTWAKIKHNR